MSHQGWHFLEASKRLRYGDGREVKVGEVYISDAKPVLCESGMHWSARLLDAINYAPGPILCRVESVEGYPVIEGSDKCVSKARKVVAMADATDMLWELSRLFAARVFWQHFDRKDYPDVAAWLDHGDFSRKVAARDAAWYAEGDAETSAARAAARAAAGSAAWDAARAAAWDAARAAAGSAAWDAAWYAAGAAAWSAAQSAMNEIAEAKALALLGIERGEA